MKLFAVRGRAELAEAIQGHLRAREPGLNYAVGPEGTVLLASRPGLARDGIRFDYIDEGHKSGLVKASFTYVVHGERPVQYAGMDADKHVAAALAFLGAARDGHVVMAEPEPAEEAAP